MSNILLDIIAKVIEVQVIDIDDESTPETIENWDSFRELYTNNFLLSLKSLLINPYRNFNEKTT